MGVVVLPKSLVAKTEAKAADVMANFNAIVAQVNGKLDLENFAESLRNSLIPTGTLLMTGRGSAPTGFLLCQGQAVSRTTYAALFAVYGTTFGAGNGTTTFNLPDFRGRVAVGPDAGAGRITVGVGGPSALGNAGGNQHLQGHTHGSSGLGTSIESVQHKHAVTGFPNTRREGNLNAYTNWDGGAGAGFGTDTESAFHTHAIVGQTAMEGSGGSDNVQPYLAVNYMVKT